MMMCRIGTSVPTSSPPRSVWKSTFQSKGDKGHFASARDCEWAQKLAALGNGDGRRWVALAHATAHWPHATHITRACFEGKRNALDLPGLRAFAEYGGIAFPVAFRSSSLSSNSSKTTNI